MRNHRKPLAGVVLWGVLAVAARTGAAEPNVIRAIDVAERAGAVELAIRGTRAPSYTVFKLQDPPRLVVDLAGADVSQVASPLEVGKAGVVAVVTGLEDPVAMLEAPSGVGYSVRRGACIGENGGVVAAVRSGEVVVSEWAIRADGTRDRTQTVLRLPKEAALNLEE